ncbi:MAG: Gfo/Idh/MocA family oxidoreductase [Anaerolineae bacterium]|nr:Gfo/Idh/MocA family oxidoreductase [Anaerolineae bacterium]
MTKRTRYAQVGLGGRSWMYSTAIVETYAAHCELVGLCDTNLGRLNDRLRWAETAGARPRAFEAPAFEEMLAACKPDIVIVTTVDQFHDHYICRAMELGYDVITEKPMTTDEGKCARIIETQRRTGRACRVTFNYRYSPPRTQVKHLLMSGVIGDILSVDFHWLLDTHHGADYFRRWHRNKVNSGGLMVHKATHHFDLVNWWLSDIPESVYAQGQRRFYTPQQAQRYGLTERGERCLGCAEAGRCPFYLDLASAERMRTLYLENEGHDGYYRDRCVFSEQIDIEDSMNLVVTYRSGVKMSYSLNAFMPWEGYLIAFNGSKGRLEHKCEETVYISGDGSVPGELLAEGTTIKVYPHFGTGYSVPIWQAQGGHGGGDQPLLDDIFLPQPPADPYLRAADQRAGAYSILTGVAANRSMASGQAVRVDELVSGIGLPDYPPMPRPDEPISLPTSPGQRMSLERANQLRGIAASG